MTPVRHVIDYYRHVMRGTRPIIFILGPMRSGTTLLKALLGRAEDVSHLPEIKLRDYRKKNRFVLYHELRQLSDKPITVIKDPARYRYLKEYPYISIARSKVLVAARDVHGVIPSLQRMNRERRIPNKDNAIGDLVDYWCAVYERIIAVTTASSNAVKIVRYEDLTQNPLETMADVFSFVGSARKAGVSDYGLPDSGEWRWGTDDGGETIRTFRVQLRTHAAVQELAPFLNDRVQVLRKFLGYKTL
jgi:hypothetical protein